MTELLSPYAKFIYSITRIWVGALFACHGLQKVFGLLGGEAKELGSLFWVAGTIEILTGLLVAVGFQTRLAAFIASGEMAVAYFMAHQGRALFPIQNGGELAVLYAWVFLTIAAMGPGVFAIQAEAPPTPES